MPKSDSDFSFCCFGSCLIYIIDPFLDRIASVSRKNRDFLSKESRFLHDFDLGTQNRVSSGKSLPTVMIPATKITCKRRILVLSFHCDTRKKCNMRSYTASFGASIWTETSISSSQEMYFNQNKEGGMFRLVQFQSSDEAKQLYGALMRCRHPNLAHVLQFTVEGEGGFFLAFRKQGTSLKDILEKFVDVKKFYEDNRITPFYQKILTDLLLVVRHLMDTIVKCTLDLSDIYILNGGHVMMTNFKLRGCPSAISEWKELAVVVKAINESTNYEANMEMNIFINYLESENAKCFTDLSKLPLFWTPEERRLFPRAFWNFIKGKSSLSSVMSISPFGESVNVIENNPILRQLKQHVDNYESQFGKDPYVSSVFDTRETEVRNNLALISKCLSHFHELKITSMGLKNEDEVAKCFEKAFKGYIGQLYTWALIFEASSQVKLLPQKTILSKLYKEP